MVGVGVSPSALQPLVSLYVTKGHYLFHHEDDFVIEKKHKIREKLITKCLSQIKRHFFKS